MVMIKKREKKSTQQNPFKKSTVMQQSCAYNFDLQASVCKNFSFTAVSVDSKMRFSLFKTLIKEGKKNMLSIEKVNT